MKTHKFIYLILIICLIFACQKNDSFDMKSPSGKGGSLARFAVEANCLYAVDQTDLNVFDISQANNPVPLNEVHIGWNIETIYATDSILFIGSQNGMYIYSLVNPQYPDYISQYNHITSCDPVVVDNEYAYVTLSTETWCGNNTNELHIIDITNLNYPHFVAGYEMEKPKGLGIDDNELFICDNGLKVFDAGDVNNLVLKHYFHIAARDVIPLGDILLVIGDNGLYQYKYSNDTISLLSLIPVGEG